IDIQKRLGSIRRFKALRPDYDKSKRSELEKYKARLVALATQMKNHGKAEALIANGIKKKERKPVLVDGFRDLKFGMTSEEAKKTKAADGVVLFGSKRDVYWTYDKEGKVERIHIMLGDDDPEERNKFLNLLEKKYYYELDPTDKQITAYNADVIAEDKGIKFAEIEAGMAMVRAGEDLDQSKVYSEGMFFREINWFFENGSVIFSIKKEYDVMKSTDYQKLYKNRMILNYYNPATTKILKQYIQRERKLRNTKTTIDDI
ncbi:MAG: hypothetical protein HRT89_22735, partial [Lentisphaeria bacterium]|nr:hypothetical protein [Lentisphaeria bacterium]